VPHRNAPLTELGRLRLARCIVEQGWPVARAAERFQVSRTTAGRWAARYRDQGPAGMADRSSRPHHSPRRTPAPVVRRVVHLRCKQRLGPAQIAPRVGLAASTVHAILVRCRISRLAHLDRASGQPIRRYEHAHPGGLVHVDVKKLGNIPAGGGHRLLGRATGRRNSQADRSSGRTSRHRHPLQGHGCIHAAVDDHSRLAYAEIHPDETRQTAIGFLTRAHAWFADRGITVQRVLTDNGACYRSHTWRQTCQQLGITAKRTRPYRPQTNGKVERFNRTLLEGWAYRRLYASEQARRAAFGPWLHWYNHHRPHSALGGRPPITRCTNLPEPYS
jgi:transposase InsO family protein